MMEFKLKRPRLNKLPRQKMLSELEKVAQAFNYQEFGWRDFNKVASISANPVKIEFGGWRKALTELKELLKQKNIDLIPRETPWNRIYSDSAMFQEMERIWNELGHRPSRTEWENARPKIHYSTYKKRFNGWTNACLRFIEHKTGDPINSEEGPYTSNDKGKIDTELKGKTREHTRIIPLKVRIQVLDRDGFKCTICGRSPATDFGVELHVDHKIPFSKGGKSTADNLQTLCADCNLGKGNASVNTPTKRFLTP